MEEVTVTIGSNDLFRILQRGTDHNIIYFVEQCKDFRTFEKVIKILNEYGYFNSNIIEEITIGGVNLYPLEVIEIDNLNENNCFFFKKINKDLYLVLD